MDMRDSAATAKAVSADDIGLPATQGLTPTQRRIVRYLYEQRPKWQSGKDIHRALWPVTADLGNVKVQIHRAIEKGAPIERCSYKGRLRRGYRYGRRSA